jgi:hypothetical protein
VFLAGSSVPRCPAIGRREPARSLPSWQAGAKSSRTSREPAIAAACGILSCMSSAKATVRKLLDELPDDASLEDIQYHIYVREKIEHGIRDAEAGRVISQEDAKRRLAKWLDK